jgi:hypothetical protein
LWHWGSPQSFATIPLPFASTVCTLSCFFLDGPLWS